MDTPLEVVIQIYILTKWDEAASRPLILLSSRYANVGATSESRWGGTKATANDGGGWWSLRQPSHIVPCCWIFFQHISHTPILAHNGPNVGKYFMEHMGLDWRLKTAGWRRENAWKCCMYTMQWWCGQFCQRMAWQNDMFHVWSGVRHDRNPDTI